jgi:hypothetical protein
MSALSVNPPFPIFLDIDGQPLDAGYIYLGVANQDTEANPIQAYWDAALTVAATQPIRTRGGFPVNAGVPARVYVNSDFSIVVKNRNGFQVFSSPTCTDRFNDAVVQVDSSDVTFLQAGTGAVTRTAQAKMRDTVSVKDFGAVGDGVADDTAAITAALAAADDVFVPPGTYLISSTISIAQFKVFRGVGYKSRLSANSISGPVISITSGTGPTEVSGFRITGTATSGVSVNNAQTIVVDNISLWGLTATNGFVFVSTWGSAFSNLWTNGSTLTNAGFICGQDFNANDCRNWYTGSSFYNGGSGVSHGSSWTMVCLQDGQYGIYIGSYQGASFNGVYMENVVHPLRLGVASTKLARGIAFNGGDFGGPYNTHPNYASREAVIWLDYAIGCSIDGVDLSGAYNCGNAAPITFSGGGGSGAFAIARVTAAGVVQSVEVVCGGTGYTSDPTAAVGGAGSSASLTVTRSGTSVSTIAVAAGGSGYVPVVCPVAVTYNKAFKCSINSVMFNSSFGDTSPLYPWVVRRSGADSGAGVMLLNDASWLNSANGNAATLMKTRSNNYTHALIEYDNTGALQSYVYTPPQYP